MESDFFDQLVNARREGTAPAQQDAPPSRPAPDPVEVVFDVGPGLMPDPTIRVCRRCGAIVAAASAPIHAEWHRGLGA